ncbi:MAG: hypothetical protein Fur0022_10910 [Anaerolineales bacterium]
MFKKLIPYFLLALILVACQPAANTPRQIASYPQAGQNSQTFSPPIGVPPTTILVYNANLDLTVWNVEDAANNALEKAAEYGGYLSASNTWMSNGQTYATLTFAIPAENYDRALSAFKRLGTVTHEQVSGKLYPSYSGQNGWDYTSYITLNLSERFETITWPSMDIPDLRPIRTLSTAIGVLVMLLGFLLDVAIWLTVVVGPFILIGWVIRRLMRGYAQPSKAEKPPD